jgi:DNA-binding transcriptional LysR family regulator
MNNDNPQVMLPLNQLRTFLDVARLGSVREAAEHLAVSQPAVSAAIAALQRDLGARLVEREGRGLRLTDAGRRLEGHGRRIFALMEEGRRDVRQAAALTGGRIRLGAVTTAAEHLVPDLLHAFREREPGIDVDLEVANHRRVWDRLAHWEVDLVIAGRPPAAAPLRSVATRAHELVVIASAGELPGPGDLARATWLLREPGSGTRLNTEDVFALLGIAPPRLTIGSNGAIEACVRAGLGLSLVSRDAVAAELRSGHLQVVPTPVTPLARNWHLVASAERELNPAIERFMTCCADALGFALV